VFLLAHSEFMFYVLQVTEGSLHDRKIPSFDRNSWGDTRAFLFPAWKEPWIHDSQHFVEMYCLAIDIDWAFRFSDTYSAWRWLRLTAPGPVKPPCSSFYRINMLQPNTLCATLSTQEQGRSSIFSGLLFIRGSNATRGRPRARETVCLHVALKTVPTFFRIKKCYNS
jgi:hypothetical protein